MPRADKFKVILDSEAGDRIGGGAMRTFDSQNSMIQVISPNKNEVCLTIRRKEPQQEGFRVQLGAQKGKKLRKGDYPQANRFGDEINAQVDLGMGGRGSNKSFGELTINKISFTKTGMLRLLDADFLSRSEHSDAPALRGTIYFSQKPQKAEAATA